LAENKLYLLLGSNLGDRIKNLEIAIEHLKSALNISEFKISSVYQSEPWGYTHQPWFLNCALQGHASSSPVVLLKIIKDIELAMGRKPSAKWHERLIDIDILFYGKTIFNKPQLTIPHPHLHERKFTLVCLHELSPGFIHPVLKKRISTLLKNCNDTSVVKNYS
jgi:2-amino-4-hydroxy-6-hydroxymethyldihydropteridine diphosphokinase